MQYELHTNSISWSKPEHVAYYFQIYIYLVSSEIRLFESRKNLQNKKFNSDNLNLKENKILNSKK